MYALSTLVIAASYLALVAFLRSPTWTAAVACGLAVLAAMYANYGAIYTLIFDLYPHAPSSPLRAIESP